MGVVLDPCGLTTQDVSYGTVLPDDVDVWPDQRDETQPRLTDLGGAVK